MPISLSAELEHYQRLYRAAATEVDCGIERQRKLEDRAEAAEAALTTARQALEGLKAFVAEVAGQELCDDPHAPDSKCGIDSGPYCSRHEWFDPDVVLKARAVLAALLPPEPTK